MATFLTQHFTLEEMLESQTAARFRFDEQFAPPVTVIENLVALCENVLVPLRESTNATVLISSGYRCPRVNAKVGGALKSQHLIGQAADIFSTKFEVEELFRFIRNGSLPFDQVIQEFGRWVHVSFGPENRRQPLRAIKLGNGRTKYLPG
ncbi:D-Ala-D-Ala carboxypeptidase family metallohydrolase [Dyadobacter sandarakinus]|uniref:Peptidase M15A n=1 Tax=Dyadobacter sandarakinus TaxID=2747268 RepID=A0ABX7I6J0_9BACT|nr:D-Ala-D-Ala carboxypeptidase family metallohydrolase [Dyadobacter sandarakinus]QRR01405.1 peptidase M15A [Dyadobacter sandarakinus]